ncbi:major facilitator superfamily domain-containing protein [Peziza echinospora]|nr:major facilitator superfamily domain-containing protein [Peziza echinospora]
MASMAICPLYWSRFSERSGRRTVYILSFTLFILFSLGAALAPIPHIWFLILMRMGIGGSAGAVQSVGAGTISDIWEVHQRGKAMGWFYLGPLMGPLIAPLIGGGLTSKWGWRATQWFILIFAVVIFCGLVTSLPETLRRKDAPKVRVETVDDLDVVGADIDVEERKVGGNENGDHGRDNELDGTLTNNTPNSTTQDLASGEVLEKRKTTNIDNLPGNNAPDIDNQIPPSQKSRWNRIYHGIIDPFLSLKYLLYPPVALTVGYSTFAYMCVYVLNTSMQSTLSSPPYNYSPGTVGLFYIPPALGNFTGSIIGGRWTDRIMKRQARKRQRKGEGNGEFIPEDRMKENALLGGILFPLSLLCYGWTVKRYSFWLVPVFPTAFFGFGSMLLFGMCTTMLTEFVPGKSSSAVAVQNFIRNIFACISSSVTATLLNALGPAILFTIMGGIGLCCLAIPLIMKTYGPRWRENVGRYDLS